MEQMCQNKKRFEKALFVCQSQFENGCDFLSHLINCSHSLLCEQFKKSIFLNIIYNLHMCHNNHAVQYNILCIAMSLLYILLQIPNRYTEIYILQHVMITSVTYLKQITTIAVNYLPIYGIQHFLDIAWFMLYMFIYHSIEELKLQQKQIVFIIVLPLPAYLRKRTIQLCALIIHRCLDLGLVVV